MSNRRNFIKSCAAAAVGTTICTNASARTSDPVFNSREVTGYAYNLPEFKKGSRLLFQGDSITDMNWGRNETDRNHYLGHGYVYLIAARLGVDLPETRLNFYNRGISGNKLGDLRSRWHKDAIAMKPDLLSIMIGINDVDPNLKGVNTEAWEADFRFILDASLGDNPDLRLVLLDPFVLATGPLTDEVVLKKYRLQLERFLSIIELLAQDYQAVHIRTQDIFDRAARLTSPGHWIWDGVHPLPQGHELIARNWIQEVSARWGSDKQNNTR